MELLQINSLTKSFPGTNVCAVRDVNFAVLKGEVLGLVGESGCGKSTLAKSMLRLIDVQKGSVLYKGQDILKIPRREIRKLRRYLQIIFQDPYMSLDPRMQIGESIEEVLIILGELSRKNRKKRVLEVLERVGLDKLYRNRLPSELSGGERQRVGIARALATGPEFLICDEPVSSLDISIQAQILNLLMDIQREKELTYLFISHDLDVVAAICDRVMVMHDGRIIEKGGCEEVFNNPKTEYARNLLNSRLSIYR